MDDYKRVAATFTKTLRVKTRLWILAIFSIAIVLAAVAMPPVPQPHTYHLFADQRMMLGIPNFMNVVSNLAILLSGLAGLSLLWRSYNMSNQRGNRPVFITAAEYWPYLVLFTSVVMTAPGSAYYHWGPDNAGLFWDRLPIAIGVTALLATVLSERIHPKLGFWSLPVLVLIGAGSVLYWYWGEQQGAGNLNFYIVIQFYSLLLVVLLSLILPSRYTHGNDIYKIIGLYAIAKLVEILDHQIFDFGHVISGHTVKHLLAAWAVWWIVRMLQRRDYIVDSNRVGRIGVLK
ncbi:alkaline phytoceramidase [Nitrosomonas sp.]|uniref:alkaline phytoceramidase n=1 Tax=Nitrosomonas sp. TaxID=42353 RepID=UPI0020804546|nr:alkaline phytoceramidase [Nitrosomonas sp.]GJL74196.1 MAG: membrane protein [Nitrosomonas sp.]